MYDVVLFVWVEIVHINTKKLLAVFEKQFITFRENVCSRSINVKNYVF